MKNWRDFCLARREIRLLGLSWLLWCTQPICIFVFLPLLCCSVQASWQLSSHIRTNYPTTGPQSFCQLSSVWVFQWTEMKKKYSSRPKQRCGTFREPQFGASDGKPFQRQNIHTFTATVSVRHRVGQWWILSFLSYLRKLILCVTKGVLWNYSLSTE